MWRWLFPIVAALGLAWAGSAAGQEVVREEQEQQASGAGDATSAINNAQEPESPWGATEVPVEDLAPALQLRPRVEPPRSITPPKRNAPEKPAPVKPAPAKSKPPVRQSTHVKQWETSVVPVEATHSVGSKPIGEAERIPQEAAPAEVHALATSAVAAPAPAGQGGGAPVPGGAPATAPAKKVEPVSSAEKPAQQYCINISSAAADARFAWEKKSMEEVARDLDDRIAKLEEKTEEYKKWLAKRDEFANKAQTELVSIYTKMKPDAAAAQLADMNEEMAAALLLKLKPTNASAILNEIDPKKGARLAMILGLAARNKQPKRAEAAPPGEAAPPAQPAGRTPTP